MFFVGRPSLKVRVWGISRCRFSVDIFPYSRWISKHIWRSCYWDGPFIAIPSISHPTLSWKVPFTITSSTYALFWRIKLITGLFCSALYAVLENNYDSIHLHLHSCIGAMVKARTWNDCSFGLSSTRQGNLNGIVVFKTLCTVYYQWCFSKLIHCVLLIISKQILSSIQRCHSQPSTDSKLCWRSCDLVWAMVQRSLITRAHFSGPDRVLINARSVIDTRPSSWWCHAFAVNHS